MEARQAVERLGLELPTEAQWEWAARAGTSTPWFTGTDPSALADTSNLADAAAGRAFEIAQFEFEDWDDGFAIHAPVDRMLPSPLGLHHVIGNVYEWCQDVFDIGFYAASPLRDPLNEVGEEDPPHRIFRGACFLDNTFMARSSTRIFLDQEVMRHHSLGIRPARAID